MNKSVIFHFLLLFVSPHAARAKIELTEDGAYTGLLVWIKDEVTYEEGFLETLKNQFIEASQTLYNATSYNNNYQNGSARYIGDVTVIVPSSWNESTECERMKSGDRTQAQFIVNMKAEGHTPLLYTKIEHTHCGKEQAGPVYVPEIFVKRPEQVRAIHGSVGVALVHEFSHLRYGLFDESTEKDGQGNCWVMPWHITIGPTALEIPFVSVEHGVVTIDFLDWGEPIDFLSWFER